MKNISLYRRMISYALVYWPLILFSVALSFFVVNFEAFSLWFGASLVKTLFDPTTTAPVQPSFSVNNLNEILKYWTYRLITRTTLSESDESNGSLGNNHGWTLRGPKGRDQTRMSHEDTKGHETKVRRNHGCTVGQGPPRPTPMDTDLVP